MKNLVCLNLHDAIIKSISLTSRVSFLSDIEIRLNQGNASTLILKMRNCFMGKLDFNLWIVGNDSIRDWSFDMPENRLQEIENFKRKAYIAKEINFSFFGFRTNITNSMVEFVYETNAVEVLYLK